MNKELKKLLGRAGVFVIIGLIWLLAYGMYWLICGGFSGPMSNENVYVLLGCIVVASVVILFGYSRISDNWDTIRKSRTLKKVFAGKKYDRLTVTIPKGKMNIIQEAANREYDSINAYVNKAILTRLGLNEWPNEGDNANR